MYVICFVGFDTEKKLYLSMSYDEICVTEKPEEAGPLFSSMSEAVKYLKKNNKKIETVFNKAAGDRLGIITIKEKIEVDDNEQG